METKDLNVEVRLHTSMYFSTRKAAREFVIKLLELGITFIDIKGEKIENGDPEPVAPDPVAQKPKKVQVPKKRQGPKPESKKRHGPKPSVEVTKEMVEWLKDNRQGTTAPKLHPRFNKMFGVKVSLDVMQDILRRNNIMKNKGPKHDKGLDPKEAFKGMPGHKDVDEASPDKSNTDALDDDVDDLELD